MSFNILKTLNEVEENIIEEEYQDKELIHLIINSSKRGNKINLDKKNAEFKTRLNKLKNKSLLKFTKKKLQDTSYTSFSSINEDYVSLNGSLTPQVQNVTIDYDQILINSYGDLAKLTFVNDLEKYLIIRIYSNVNRLTTILNDLDSIDLKHYLSTPDENDCLPLYYAIKAECLNAIKLLVSKGSSLDKTTKSGDPAIHLCCLLGVSIKILDYFLSFKSQINLYERDQEGWTILHCACNQGHLDIVKYLLNEKYMNLNIKDSISQNSCLQLAAINNRMEIIEYFLSFSTRSSLKEKKENDDLIKNFDNLKIKNEIVAKSNEVIKDENHKEKMSISETSSQISSTNTHKKSKSKAKKKLVIQEVKTVIDEIKKPPIKLNLESNLVYYEDKMYDKKELVSIYKNFVLDLNSINRDGQTLLHLACKYGRYDVVKLLLNKYGSNQLDVNLIDFKGKTCLDFAWNWILNLNNENGDENNKSLFYDKQNSFYIQRKGLIIDSRIDNEIKLLFLLSSYGAKFSSIKELLYNIESLNELENNEVGLPYSLFYPEDHVSFNYIRLQSNLIISIQTYLKCILHVFKLGIPSMFLKKNVNNKTNYQSEFMDNFNCLTKFIHKNVIDQFERQFYLTNIQDALNLLSKY